MDVRHLRYFVAVAEKLHFGEAARSLAISQPPLSKRISEFEESLGVRLFDRTSRGVSLTTAGLTLLPKARLALLAFDDAINSVRSRRPAHLKQVRAGFPADTSRKSLGMFMETLRTENVEAIMIEGSTAEHHKALLAGELDLAVLRQPFNQTGLWVSSSLRQDLGVVLARNHPLTKSHTITLADLQPYALALFPRKMSPGLHDQLLDDCAKGGYSPKRIEYVVRMTVVHVSKEKAVTFRPGANIRMSAFEGADLVWRPLQGTPLRWRTAIATLSEDQDPVVRRAVKAALGALQAHDGWEIDS